MSSSFAPIPPLGTGRVVRWNGRALINYTRCRTGKGNLLGWKKILVPGLDDNTSGVHM